MLATQLGKFSSLSLIIHPPEDRVSQMLMMVDQCDDYSALSVKHWIRLTTIPELLPVYQAIVQKVKLGLTQHGCQSGYDTPLLGCSFAESFWTNEANVNLMVRLAMDGISCCGMNRPKDIPVLAYYRLAKQGVCFDYSFTMDDRMSDETVRLFPQHILKEMRNIIEEHTMKNLTKKDLVKALCLTTEENMQHFLYDLKERNNTELGKSIRNPDHRSECPQIISSLFHSGMAELLEWLMQLEPYVTRDLIGEEIQDVSFWSPDKFLLKFWLGVHGFDTTAINHRAKRQRESDCSDEDVDEPPRKTSFVFDETRGR